MNLRNFVGQCWETLNTPVNELFTPKDKESSSTLLQDKPLSDVEQSTVTLNTVNAGIVSLIIEVIFKAILLFGIGGIFALGATLEAQAATWHLSHSGYATNSNDLWEKKNGHPRVGMWTIDYGDPDQGISFYQDPTTKHWYLVNIRTSKCYTASGIAERTHIILVDCTPGNTKQLFKLHKVASIAQGLIHARFSIHGNNLCLHNSQLVNYGALGLMKCDNSLMQLWEMKHLNTYTAKDVVLNNAKVPTSLSHPPGYTTVGGNGSGGNDQPIYGGHDTLHNTGGTGNILLDGLLFILRNGKLLINGAEYAIEEYYEMKDALEAFVTAPKDHSHTVYYHPEYGEEKWYLSDWGIYVKLTGSRAQRATDRLAVNGTATSVIAGGIVGVAANPISGIITGAMSEAYVLNTSDDIQRCVNDKNRAYLRFHLNSGGWANSLAHLPSKGVEVFKFYTSVSCD